MVNRYFTSRNTLVAITFASVGLLYSCQKGAELFVPDPGQPNGADTNWVGSVTGAMPIAILKDSLILEPQADSINSNQPDTLITGGDIQIIIPANSLENTGGTTVEGKVKIQFLALQKRGDLIRQNTPTIMDSAVLSTVGTFFTRFTQNGNELLMKSSAAVQLNIPGQATVQQTKLYFGLHRQTGIYNWKPAEYLSNYIDFSNNRYFATTNTLGWISAGYTLPASSSQLQLSLPLQYTNANTEAYVVLKNHRSVVRMSDHTSEKKFVCDIVPLDQPATIVVISKQGNDYFAGTEDFSSAGGPQVVNILPVKMSLGAIKQLLDGL